MTFHDFLKRSDSFAYLETADSDPYYGRGDHLLDCLFSAPSIAGPQTSPPTPSPTSTLTITPTVATPTCDNLRTPSIATSPTHNAGPGSTSTSRLGSSLSLIQFPHQVEGLVNNSAYLKTRTYLSLMREGEYVVNWHYDGFTQLIAHVYGSGKTFEIAPPVSSGRLSGWLQEDQSPKECDVQSVTLRPLDILYLPARWCHRVTTRGISWTINKGYAP